MHRRLPVIAGVALAMTIGAAACGVSPAPGSSLASPQMEPSWVNCTGSPSGSSFAKMSPGPPIVPGVCPWMNVSIRPSGDSAGADAASVKLVTGV